MKFIAVLLLFPGLALAQYQPYTYQQPKAGYTFDPNTGNSYAYNKDTLGNTTVNGLNTQTGTTWTQRIDRSGNMNGRDAQGNYYNYNNTTKTYQNYGTGQTCFGTGIFRSCTK